MAGATVEAGTYELFTIPSETEWTLILQTDRSQWGSYGYDPAYDVARILARPERASDAVESLTIGFEETALLERLRASEPS